MEEERSTRDIAIATKTKVDILVAEVAALNEKVEKLTTLADQATGVINFAKIFDRSLSGVSGGVAVYLYENWSTVAKSIGLK